MTKHHWYGDSSPYHFEHRHDFGGFLEESASHAVIWDRGNLPQLQSVRDTEDGHDQLRFDALLQLRRSALLY